MLRRSIGFLIALIMIINTVVMPTKVESSTVDKLKPEVAKAYHNILKQKKQETYHTGEFDPNKFIYADVIDFNGDGVDELYILYSIDNENYDELIYTYKNEKVIEVQNKGYAVMGWKGNSHNLYLSKKEGKTYIIRQSEFGIGDGEEPYYNLNINTNIYNEFNGSYFNEIYIAKKESYSLEGENGPTRYEGEEAKNISQSEYKKIKSRYEGDEKTQILVDDFGSVHLEEGLTDYNELLNRLKETYSTKAFEKNNLKDIYTLESQIVKKVK